MPSTPNAASNSGEEFSHPAVSLTFSGDIAVIALDDGKANAMSYDVVDALRQALALANSQAKAIVLAGRDGVMSAGFDLKEIVKGEAERDALISTGGKFFSEVFTTGLPVVAACTGHAVAGGLVFLLVADSRIGRAGSYTLGFNEVSIGVPMPEFGIALTQYRIAGPAVERILLGDLLDPWSARDVGILDEVVEGDHQAVVNAAIVRANELASRSASAYAVTKERARKGLGVDLDSGA